MQQRASAAAPSLTPRLADGVGNNSNFPSDILEELPQIRSATTGHAKAEPGILAFELDPGDVRPAAGVCAVVPPLTTARRALQVLVFNSLIMHGAPPNRSPLAARRALALRYLGDGTVFARAKHGEGTSMA